MLDIDADALVVGIPKLETEIYERPRAGVFKVADVLEQLLKREKNKAKQNVTLRLFPDSRN